MIFDLLHISPDPSWSADVCIVGAGAAGLALAIRMSQQGKRVFLLEGGGALLEDDAQDPYLSVIAGHFHRGVHEGRFRGLGGTTTKWGGQVLELDRSDFEMRPWVEGSGWPFLKESLRPFYREALRFEGLENVIQKDSDVWSTFGEEQPQLTGVLSYLSRWCPEPNLARLHHATIKESPGIHVWLHANAIGFSLESKKITAVQARTQTGKSTDFTATRFVFCMGGIESSRFFMQPREGGLPWNRSGLLGHNFQDHIDCDVGAVLPRSRKLLDRYFASIFLNGYKYQPKIKLSPAYQREHKVLSAAATLSFAGRQSAELAQARTAVRQFARGRWKETCGGDLNAIIRSFPHLLRQTERYIRTRRSYQPSSASISLRVHCEQEPCSQSHISLDTSRDSLGLFRTKLTWHISTLELRTIRAMTLAAREALMDTADVQAFDGFDDDSQLSMRCEDSFHHMGGMRMDPSASRGVVDTDLRLHGTLNTWVCSSAVFPTSGFSNPTHTLLALAMRLAERLSK